MRTELPFNDEQLMSVLRAMTSGDIEGLDGFDLDQLTDEQRVRLICRWLEIKSQRYLERQAKLAEWAFLQRKKGAATAPADVVKDFLTSQEFMLAIGAFAAVLGLTSGLVNLAVVYRRARHYDHQQVRILVDYLIAKLSGGQHPALHAENLIPDLRALANGITPSRAQQIIDMSDSEVKRAIPALKAEGRAILTHYEAPLRRVGVAVADIYPAQEPWSLPWLEGDLPPIPTRKPQPAPDSESDRGPELIPRM